MHAATLRGRRVRRRRRRRRCCVRTVAPPLRRRSPTTRTVYAGVGNVGRVYLCRKNDDGNYFAMKVLTKAEMVRRNKVHRALTERELLALGAFVAAAAAAARRRRRRRVLVTAFLRHCAVSLLV